MQATPRLRSGLSVRLRPGRPNMPELQGYPLHPFRPQEGHVQVAVMFAFIGQELLVVIANSSSRVISPISNAP